MLLLMGGVCVHKLVGTNVCFVLEANPVVSRTYSSWLSALELLLAGSRGLYVMPGMESRLTMKYKPLPALLCFQS